MYTKYTVKINDIQTTGKIYCQKYNHHFTRILSKIQSLWQNIITKDFKHLLLTHTVKITSTIGKIYCEKIDTTDKIYSQKYNHC